MNTIYKLICIPFCIVLFTNMSNAQSLDDLKAINKTWEKFCLAFKTSNSKLLQDIHAEELVRVSGGARIADYETCMNNYSRSFENAKTQGISNTLSLRFFERVYNSTTASERGVYKLERTEKSGEVKEYYGQFHVVLKKQDGVWKIVMDYDSSEGNTIGEAAYLRAHAMDAYDKFVRKQ